MYISWTESHEQRSALWRSESQAPAPKNVIIADDTLKADTAYRYACEGTALLWRGDFQNARQLLQAMARRTDKKSKKSSANPSEAFHLHRQAQAQRARTLGMLLIPLDANYSIPLRRAPNVYEACKEAYGIETENSIVSLREILGLIGAHEWRKKGVAIHALDSNVETRIHPHYGVFSPVRGEYLNLVAEAPLPSLVHAFDIGTGTGVIAALLAKRGVKRIIATDQDPRAIACAKENIEMLHLEKQIELVKTNMFPVGQAPLIVCNPPWIPARPSSPIENAIYDPDSQMLKAFLKGLPEHLDSKGEGWLIISDIAEHLGLRTREELLSLISSAGLKVIDRLDIKPQHSKASDTTDSLHKARSQEITSLWRLAIV